MRFADIASPDRRCCTICYVTADFIRALPPTTYQITLSNAIAHVLTQHKVSQMARESHHQNQWNQTWQRAPASPFPELVYIQICSRYTRATNTLQRKALPFVSHSENSKKQELIYLELVIKRLHEYLLWTRCSAVCLPCWMQIKGYTKLRGIHQKTLMVILDKVKNS